MVGSSPAGCTSFESQDRKKSVTKSLAVLFFALRTGGGGRSGGESDGESGGGGEGVRVVMTGAQGVCHGEVSVSGTGGNQAGMEARIRAISAA